MVDAAGWLTEFNYRCLGDSKNTKETETANN